MVSIDIIKLELCIAESQGLLTILEYIPEDKIIFEVYNRKNTLLLFQYLTKKLPDCIIRYENLKEKVSFSIFYSKNYEKQSHKKTPHRTN